MTLTKRVAVIGGGAAGLVQVKALNHEPADVEIDLYEAASQLGGCWKYHPKKENFTTEEELIAAKEYNYTAVYEGLITNVKREAMQFNDFPFLNDSGPFPARIEVLEYLLRFEKSIGPYNRYLNTKVVSTVKEDNHWILTSENVLTGETNTRTYDNIVVANGHYHTPRFPDTKGLAEWMQKDPSSVVHSKFYDKASHYKDKTVLLIGGYSSGTDLALHLSATAKVVWVSAETSFALDKFENPYIKRIPKIDSYDVDTRTAKIGDRIIESIDNIIVCTGYDYHIPFFESNICKGSHIEELHQHIFYIEDPSIAILGLVRQVSPFPTTEAQASVVARSITGRLKFPPYDEMKKTNLKLLEEKGVDIHKVPFPEEADYINGLHDWLKESDALEGYQFPRLEGKRYETRELNKDLIFNNIISRSDRIVEARKTDKAST